MISAVVTEIFVILVLVAANGMLAMSEMAIVSARKARLLEKAERNTAGAREALALSESPTSFLSTIQTGITSVGILAGAFGGATIAEELSKVLERSGIQEPYAEGLSLAFIVSIITYLSIVFGELVPKRLALRDAENIACAVARPMIFLSKIAAPLVHLLSASTETVLKTAGVKEETGPDVSEEEIKLLVEEGEKAGVLEPAEREIVEEALELNDTSVVEIMTPRVDVVWLNTALPWEENLKRMLESTHNVFPVAHEKLDDFSGVVNIKDVFRQISSTGRADLSAIIRKPLCIPENKSALWALETFKEAKAQTALVLDEYGSLQGLITINDIFESMVGVMPEAGSKPKWEIVEREDGSFLVDGRMPAEDFVEMFELTKDIAGESRTVGGLVIHHLEHIPTTGETFTLERLRIEIVDMDRNRVDKILVTRTASS
ncbi:MAG TPA: hemolysin family protein [Candidatus Obscuribacterales bacterium]